MRILREMCEERTWHDRPMRVRTIVQCTRAGSCNAHAQDGGMHTRRIVQCTRTIVSMRRACACDATRRIVQGDARGTDARADRVHAIVDESDARNRCASVTTSVTGWCV